MADPPDNLNSGQTVSEPSISLLSDVPVYLALIRLGELAATANRSIDFMRQLRIIGPVSDNTLLKVCRSLAAGHILIHADGKLDPVAWANPTYSISG